MDENDLESDPLPTEPGAPMVTEEYEIRLAEGWTEESFECGPYETEETPGIEARFSAAENMELRIGPGRVDAKITRGRRLREGASLTSPRELIP